MAKTDHTQPIPLVVDLDGTLIYSDVLYEVLLVLLRTKPLYLLLLPLWVLGGKAHFKDRIAAHCDLDPADLPYNPDLLAWLEDQRRQGRPLVLATATHHKFARAIADYLGIFDQVLASDADTNLSGRRKLARLTEAFGSGGFDYAGNGYIDLEVWPEARRAIVVNPDAGVLETADRLFAVEKFFTVHGRDPWHYLRSLRPSHWLKNGLLLVPLLVAGGAETPLPMLAATLLGGLVVFSLGSSAAYLVNDLIDLPSDRRHPRKGLRPVPNSEVPLLHAMLLTGVLLAAAASLCLFLPTGFSLTLLAYLLLNGLYSLWLKRLPVLDLLALTTLYLSRVVAGSQLTDIAVPDWVLQVGALVFLSMAAAKRHVGLSPVAGQPLPHYPRLLTALGVASGLAGAALLLFNTPLPAATAGVSAVLLVGLLGRLWQATLSKALHNDPAIFALTDPLSLLLLFGAAAAWFLTG